MTYFDDLVIITLPFDIDNVPSIPLLFPCLFCFSLCFSGSPLLATSFSSGEEEIHSLLLFVPLLWGPYESHSLKSSASERASWVKGLNYSKLQGYRN